MSQELNSRPNPTFKTVCIPYVVKYQVKLAVAIRPDVSDAENMFTPKKKKKTSGLNLSKRPHQLLQQEGELQQTQKAEALQ
jgi:hypothetical protein